MLNCLSDQTTDTEGTDRHSPVTLCQGIEGLQAKLDTIIKDKRYDEEEYACSVLRSHAKQRHQRAPMSIDGH